MRSILRRLHRPVYESRVRALSGRIARQLRPGDRVLDVGCGEGTLGAAVLRHPECPPGVRVEGLENRARGGEAIPVTAYSGSRFPFSDGSFDVVVIADVLHHEQRPDDLLGECVRVARRAVVLKDHQISGFLARPRVMFLDWAANNPYGVQCLFRYNTPAEWRATARRHRLRAVVEEGSMRDLYPPGLNTVFGGRIQYFAVLEKEETTLPGGSSGGNPMARERGRPDR
ncbi:MAG: class I SAM-dependent methyltransferase [Tepidiformaceae bacterium]